jgi:hypothetical protein
MTHTDTQDKDGGITDEQFTMTTTTKTSNFSPLFFSLPPFSLLIVAVDERKKNEPLFPSFLVRSKHGSKTTTTRLTIEANVCS